MTPGPSDRPSEAEDTPPADQAPTETPVATPAAPPAGEPTAPPAEPPAGEPTEPPAQDDRRHPARTLVPVLPAETAAELAERLPWFVPEITASSLTLPESHHSHRHAN